MTDQIIDTISANDQTVSVPSNQVQSGNAVAPTTKTWVDPLHPDHVITKAELLTEAYTVAKSMTHDAVELEVKAENSKASANWTIASKFGAVQDRDVYDKAIEGWEDAYIGDVMKAIAEENPTMKNADIRKQAQKSIASFAQRKSQFMAQLDACFNGGDGAVFFLQNMTNYVRLGSEDFIGFCRAVRDSSIKGKFDHLKYMDESGKLKTDNGKLIYGKNGKIFFLDYQKPVALPQGNVEGNTEENGETESTGNARTPTGEAPKADLGGDTGGKVGKWSDARMQDVERQMRGQEQVRKLEFLQKMCDVIMEDFPSANVEFEIDGRKVPMKARQVAFALRKSLKEQEEIVKPKAQTKTERQQQVQQQVSPMIQDSIEADNTPAPTAPVFNDTVEA